MDDNAVHQQIDALVAEEHQLRSADHHTPADRARLETLEVQLDQAWDLLRQRAALRDAGGNPASAEPRPAAEVEGYLQ
jgi:hypothetical protein